MKKIVVIGGTNIDLLAHTFDQVVLEDSNPGYINKSFGGVARNIAENLARLGMDVTLLTALGKDAMSFVSLAKRINLKLSYQQISQTPTYLAVHNKNGEMVVAVSAMEEFEKLNENFILKHSKLIEDADIVVLDANLSESALSFLFKNYKKTYYVDLISSHKAYKFLPYISKIHTLKINEVEGKKISNKENPYDIGQELLNQGLKSVYLTLGKNGAYNFTNKQTDFYQKSFESKMQNDTGAGDAFFAGVIFAEQENINPLKTGTILAHMTLQTKDTVNKKIKPSLVMSLVKEK
ncbi:carbohydrate kinase family protein [Acholeplasma hippikon]|uniref:Pseudouridine kinase n=1 Tax=Acholeplasma hippikon TaxID=264636 RepID=A0A449BJ54_9MOLU|nr:carbohydrate kinase family protein [Acholeplasma hippikon]VEU82495.1 Pseudouridine kinase [Acholeplasma hippikon]